MADLPGGGEALNVAASDQWADEARMGFPSIAKGTEGVRSVSRVLGVPTLGGIFTSYSALELNRLSCLGVGYRTSCPEQLHSSSTQDRLANEVWGDGD